MKKILIFSIIIFLGFLLTCQYSSPPDEEDEYTPTIIYKIESSTHTSCSLVEYTNEDGDVITLNNVTLPWEYEMNVDDNDFVSLHVQETQTPVISGTVDAVPLTNVIEDDSANFGTLLTSCTVLNLDDTILHQISEIMSNTLLRLNFCTFDAGEDFEIYDRMYFMTGIYRVDETGNEDPLVYASQLYYTMDLTLDTYAF